MHLSLLIIGVLSHIKYKVVDKSNVSQISHRFNAHHHSGYSYSAQLFFSRIWQIQTNLCKGILQSALVGIICRIFEDIYENVEYLHGEVSRFEIFGAKKTISIGFIKLFAMLAKTFCHWK